MVIAFNPLGPRFLLLLFFRLGSQLQLSCLTTDF